MATATASNIFEQLGVTPVINARGNQTVLGGSTPSARVRRAMQDSERYYVDMKQLLDRSGQIIAGLLECEAAYVTPGTAAAMALGTAACITGDDLDKMSRLPDTTGMKNTVVIQSGHHYHYQRAVNVPGARIQEVDSAQFEASLGPNVATVLFPAHLDGAPGTLPLAEVLELAHTHNVPVLVDAAGRVYPLDKFKSYTKTGADLVAFGAKYIGALNGSGILAGRKDLVEAASMHGFVGFETVAWERGLGRPLKLDRQTIVAVVAALQEWFETDHPARIAGFERRLKAMQSELQGAAGVQQSLVPGDGPSPLLLRLDIDASKARADVPTLISKLEAGTPAIAVGRVGDTAILVNPATMREEDDGVVASRLGNLLL